MRKKFVAFILSLAFFICVKSGSTAVTEEGISRARLGKENGVLDENIKVTIVDADDEGNPIFRQWTPSASGIEETGNVYVDEDSKATFKINEGEDINGVIDGNPVLFSDGGYKFGKAYSRNDYIDWKRKPTYAKKCQKNTRVKAIVETVIVCDKKFGDAFKQNYQKILNYWVVYMWDVNMRYKSLPSNDISFQVNGIVVMANTSAQPFIENARKPNRPDGRAEVGGILDMFSKWVYKQRRNLPPHDLIPLVTNVDQDQGELSWVGGACTVDQSKRYLGALIWQDSGNYRAPTVSVTAGAHEMGHSLGALRKDDPDFPGGCTERGFIMENASDDLRYFFSNCSDRMISNFVRSESASCLRTLSSNKPQLDPSFDNPKAPSIQSQCRDIVDDPEAWVEDKDPNSCKTKICRTKNTDKAYKFVPIDNSECSNGGRCFRGFCRQQPQFFKNVGSGLCIQASNPFSNAAPFLMVKCPSPGTPLDKLFVTEGNSGTMLLSPFQMGTEVGERCGYVGNAEGDTIKTDRCDVDNEQQGWDFKGVGNKQFLLKHVSSGKCAKPKANNVGSHIGTYKTCDSKDKNFKWERF